MCVGILLGKLKDPVAEKLHSKAVQAEAEMNQVEWLSGGRRSSGSCSSPSDSGGADTGARLREHGHAVTGEVFVVRREGSGMDARQLVRAAEGATKELERLDWRLHGIGVVPVGALEASIPPRVGETSGAER